MIEVAVKYQKPVRIGVNWGSLDGALLTQMMDENSLLAEPKDAREVTMEAMVVSALNSAAACGKIRAAARPDYLECEGQRRAGFDRCLSLTGGALQLSAASRANRSGHGRERNRGLVRGAGRGAAGRHRRYHSRLTYAAPGGDRTEEVRVAQQILQSIGIRSFTPQVTACPGCGRTTSTFFQEMAEQIQSYLREQMPSWKGRYWASRR